MSALYFGGIEGGATHSKAVICDQNGSLVSEVVGPGTNHWTIGIPEVARRIADMISQAKTQANIEQTVKLQSLGLSLSGCEQEATNKALENELLEKHPNVSTSYYVGSDTLGSIFTASPLGGMVLIAGTGSNALLRNPDGKLYSCGGWGNFLADEGAAWWISHKAVKTCFDHDDKLELCPYDTTAVWQQVKKHFNVETRYDMLDHCYAKFDKAFFAGLCLKLSQIADKGDALSLHLFSEAGRYLAKATLALLPHVSSELLYKGNLNIVCVGSVWKSWHLIKAGFSNEIAKSAHSFGLNLLHLTAPMAYGAAYIAADLIKFDLPRSYSHNYEIFHHVPRTEAITNGNGVYTNGISKKCNGTTHTNGTTTNGTHATNGKAATTKKTNGTTHGTSNTTTNGTRSILVTDG